MPQQAIDYAVPLRRPSIHAILALGRSRRLVCYVLIAVLCYVGSYICLSGFGTFEPLVIGANGVKAYTWAPSGFVKDYRRRWALFKFYLPLYFADRAFWHRDGEAYSGQYPVHTPKSVNEVYAAWKR
jgi:hypothetical protein